MNLTGLQIQQVCDALLDAYDDTDSLRRMVRYSLDQNLEAIAGGDNLSVVIFNLVTWAERHQEVDTLLEGARKDVPGNVALQQIQVEPQPRGKKTGGMAARWQRLPGGKRDPEQASIDVFLSYTRNDSRAMHRVLESLREAGLSVWIHTSLKPGTPDWSGAISAAIKQAQAMVVLLSPSATESTWVQNEIHRAQLYKKPIFPILVHGDETDAVPLSVASIQWLDGRKNLQRAVETELVPAIKGGPGEKQESFPWHWLTTAAAIAVLVMVIGGIVWFLALGPGGGLLGGLTKVDTSSTAQAPTLQPALPGTEIVEVGVTEATATATTVTQVASLPPTEAVTATAVSTDMPAEPGGSEPAQPVTPTSTEMPTATEMPTSTNTPTATNTPATIDTPTAANKPTAVTPTAVPADVDTATATRTSTPTSAFVVASTPTRTPTVTPTPRPDSVRDRKVGAEFVHVLRGQFLVGTAVRQFKPGVIPGPDPMVQPNEQPPATITIDEFWIMRTEVTNGQYGRCVEAGVCTQPDNVEWNKPGFVDYPVRNVTWHQANEYAAWVGGRLPSEAEWEAACRGPEENVYPWGKAYKRNVANVRDDVGYTLPVGSYSQKDGDSYYGLADMAGNVWEWTNSQYKDYPYSAGDGREDAGGDVLRMMRGGAWDSHEGDERCAKRNPYPPGSAQERIGFRVAMDGLGPVQ